jgi:flagellar hook-length control protein FliK
MLPLQDVFSSADSPLANSNASAKTADSKDSTAFTDTFKKIERENIESQQSRDIQSDKSEPKEALANQSADRTKSAHSSQVEVIEEAKEVVQDISDKVNDLLSLIQGDQQPSSAFGIQGLDGIDLTGLDLFNSALVGDQLAEELQNLLSQLEHLSNQLKSFEFDPLTIDLENNDLIALTDIKALQDRLSNLTSFTSIAANTTGMSELLKAQELKAVLTQQLSRLNELVANTAIDGNNSTTNINELLSSLRSQLHSLNETNSTNILSPEKLALSKTTTGDLSLAQLTQSLGEQLAKSTLNEVDGAAPLKTLSEIAQTLQSSTSPLNPMSAAKSPMAGSIPFYQAQWSNNVAERVVWMNSMGLKEAEIQLDPPELGAMQVKVSMVNEQAHVSFVVQHASVRDALDQTAMRLREMFEAEGVELVDVDISDQTPREKDENEGFETNQEQQFVENSSNTQNPENTVSITPLSELGLVNTYV